MHFALVGSCRGSWARGLRLLQQAVHVDPVPYSRIVGGKEGLNHNLSALLLAVLGYLAALKISGKRVVGLAVGIGILSHLVLDLIRFWTLWDCTLLGIRHRVQG